MFYMRICRHFNKERSKKLLYGVILHESSTEITMKHISYKNTNMILHNCIIPVSEPAVAPVWTLRCALAAS